MRHLLFFVALAVAASGCAGRAMHTAVAHALPCPEDDTVVQETEDRNGNKVWEASGCGRNVTLVCTHRAFSRRTICIESGRAEGDAPAYGD